MVNYPPGMTSSDYDHTEGPLTETEKDMICPHCGVGGYIVVNTWRASATTHSCDACNTTWEEPDDNERF